ncbi:hypothetical protein Tco_0098017 [Tanacetum coccineum]
MDASGGSREEKDDDHESNCRKRNFDRLGFKNMEGSDKKSSDEVPQSSDQMEVMEDGLGRMFGNSDRVVENSNAEFIASQMDIRGSVGVVGGQFGNELSANTDMWNQRKRQRGQNTGNTGSSSHGMALDCGNLLGQSTSGTQLVLHSESSNGLGQGQGTGGTRSVLHSESSSRNVYGQGQQGMPSQLVSPTAAQYQRGRFTVTHEQPVISGVSRPRGVHEHNVRVRLDPNIASGNNFRPRGQLAQSGSDTHTYQRGRFRVTTYEQPSANPGFFDPRAVQEHNMRVQSHPDIVGRNVTRLRGPAVQLGSDTHTYQRGRFRVTCEQPSGNPGFFMPRGVQEHNMRVRSDANVVRANMFRQGTPQMSQQRGFFGTPRNPFFPTFASQNVGLPVSSPPAHMGMLLNANRAVEARDREEVVSDQGSNSEDF